MREFKARQKIIRLESRAGRHRQARGSVRVSHSSTPGLPVPAGCRVAGADFQGAAHVSRKRGQHNYNLSKAKRNELAELVGLLKDLAGGEK